MIPIYKPYLPKKSLGYLEEAVSSGWISSLGKYQNLCEEKLKEKFGYKYVLLVNNGTSATHLLAKSLHFKYPNIKKIIVPNNCYVAAYNSFLYDKNFELRSWYVDCETWNIDLKHLNLENINYRDTAILLVHNLGNIINLPRLKGKYPNIIFLEDNCEGISGKYENVYSGTESLCSSLSFFANKSITSGEGGAFCTSDKEIYEYANLIHGQAQSEKRYIHSELGYNYRITNLHSALLYGQLEIFDEVIERKKEIFDYYRKHLSNIQEIQLQKIEDGTKHANWMFGVRILNNKSLDKLNKYFLDNGIEIRPFFYPIHFHGHLKKIACKADVTPILLSKECFMIPSFPELKKDELKFIVSCIKKYLKEIKC